MASKVIGIKADTDTLEKFEKITKKSNKDWLEKHIQIDSEKEKIAFPTDEKGKPEKFVSIPASEYESLLENTGPMKHSTLIFERVVMRTESVKGDKNFNTVFNQLEAFWKMNGMTLTKRKDVLSISDQVWVIDCQHKIGRAFSRFFFHLVNKICMWSD